MKLRHIHIQTRNSYKKLFNYIHYYGWSKKNANFNKIRSLETPCTVFILINKK